MYIPRHFGLEDRAQISEFVAAAGAADLVTFDGAELTATLLPVIWDQDDSTSHTSGNGDGSGNGDAAGYGRLLGHIALANRQWETAQPGVPALAIVHGPQAYISPGWYAAKREHGRVVPTWNYVTVHAYGRPQVIDDTRGVLVVLAKLAAAYEGKGPDAWGLGRLPPGNAEMQTKGIVAFRMLLKRVETKIKLSQNRDFEDRTRVIAKLEASDNQDALATARWMKRMLP